MMGGRWQYGDWMPWGGLLMGGMMIAFCALVILGIVWLVRQSTGRPAEPRSHPSPGPMEILDRRFAAGEIDEEEYRSRRRVLAGELHADPKT